MFKVNSSNVTFTNANLCKLQTCEQKVAVLSSKNGQILKLDIAHKLSGCVNRNENINGQVFKFISCKHVRTVNSNKERCWFMAISDCSSTKGLTFFYKLYMINAKSLPLKHFSADEYCEYTFLSINQTNSWTTTILSFVHFQIWFTLILHLHLFTSYSP